MTENVRYCCRPMKCLLHSRGRRGMAVAITQDPTPPHDLVFVLESRSVEQADPAWLPSRTTMSLGDLFLAYIRYCPWCGAGLLAHYSPYAEHLAIVPNELGLSHTPHPDIPRKRATN